MKFGKVSKTKDLNEYDDVRIVGKTFSDDEGSQRLSLRRRPVRKGQMVYGKGHVSRRGERRGSAARSEAGGAEGL